MNWKLREPSVVSIVSTTIRFALVILSVAASARAVFAWLRRARRAT
jgi:hypothetical protein